MSLWISPISKNTNDRVYHHEASLVQYDLVVHYSVNNSLSRAIVDHHPSIQKQNCLEMNTGVRVEHHHVDEDDSSHYEKNVKR